MSEDQDELEGQDEFEAQKKPEANENDGADPGRHRRDRIAIRSENGWTVWVKADDETSSEIPASSETHGGQATGLELFVGDPPEEETFDSRNWETPDLGDCDAEPEGSIDLYDPADLRRILTEAGQSCADIPPDEQMLFSRCDYLGERNARLTNILNDRRGPRRRRLVADPLLLGRLSGLRAECPGFAQVIALIRRSACLSLVSGSALALAPMLLVGPAGVGKTHFARRLATALGTPFEFICGDLLSDRGTVTGLSPVWRAAKPGRIAEALLQSPVLSPLFVIDEVDKIDTGWHENPLAFLHTMLEPENARKFCDEYLAFPMRADRCFWILTANETNVLPPSVLDRLLIVAVAPPELKAMAIIARNIYRDANARHADWFSPDPSEEFIAALVRHNPRKASKIVEFAMGYAAADGRQALLPDDLASSTALLESHEEACRKVGFTAP